MTNVNKCSKKGQIQKGKGVQRCYTFSASDSEQEEEGRSKSKRGDLALKYATLRDGKPASENIHLALMGK